MLFIGVTATDNDFIDNYDGLKKSLANIREAFNENVYAVLLFQTKKDTFPYEMELNSFDEVVLSNVFGTSFSRNMLIDIALKCSKLHSISHFLFHDTTIRWSKGASRFISLNLNDGFVPFRYLNLTEDEYFSLGGYADEIIYKKPNVLIDTYVGSYIFKIKDIMNVRFNEDVGPGENTHFKSGEDVLFLCEYFKATNKNKLNKAKCLYLYHPARPANLEKQLTYSKGQGYLYKNLILEYPSFYIWFMFFCFVGNSFFRCFLFKKNSFYILKNRFIGFWSK